MAFVKVAAINWSKLAFPMFKTFPMIQKVLKDLFPNEVDWTDPISVTNKFLKSLQDREFQDLAITLAQQFLSHRGTPLAITEKDQFKNYDTYGNIRATPLPGRTEAEMPTIIEGGYQSTTAQLPRKEVLPSKTFSDIMNEINTIRSKPEFQTLDPAGKRKVLSNLVDKYSRQLSPFREYLKKNLPLGTS